MSDQTTKHQPVLLEEVLKVLRPTAGETFLDLTAGYGGHASAITELTGSPNKAVLVDRDAEAIETLRSQFGQAEIIQSDFLAASQKLAQEGRRFDIVLADLGLSSPHLNDPERGFSFRHEAPLDMRMDGSQALTAEEVVNTWPEDHLAQILSEYGEEPKARQIAASIVANRPLKTTSQLAAIAKQAWPGHSRVHPATRTFQAVRMAVNDELNQLADSLPLWLQILSDKGRLAVISFHSGEDRLVKKFLAEHSQAGYDAELQLLTKSPIVPGQTEIDLNPRARSAKLRAAAKINTKKGSG